jgi:hypothetical protein
MKIAFLVNKLTIRGTEVAMYDYADYNERILCNKSIIITRPYEHVKVVSPYDIDNYLPYEKFKSRFSVFYYIERDDIDDIIEKEKIDILYIIKAGFTNDNLYTKKCKCVIHCVFNTSQPHGDIYTPISDYVNKICKTVYPVLPHMINVFDTDEDLRNELNIPKDATVFGTHGGKDSFSIDYIKLAVINVANKYKNIYFIFLNINPFCANIKNIIFLDGTTDMKYKRKFINTNDAMLYGRINGESFGLCCGEFSICNKPIIGRTKNYNNINLDTFHIETLGDDIISHDSYDELYNILTNWNTFNKDVSKNGYKKYTPEYVMNIFKKLIIDNS